MPTTSTAAAATAAAAARLLAAALLAASLAACAGRDPRHIPVVEPNDTAMNCQALSALIASNNYRIESLYAEHERASDSNVAIGVVGALLFWPALFALDTSDAERVEAQALSDRNRYLASVGMDKKCQGTAVPVEVKFDTPEPAVEPAEKRSAGLPE